MGLKGTRSFNWRNIRLFPSISNVFEFAQAARKQYEEFKPTAVALEYPSPLKDWILKGIQRLPNISVVCYEEPDETEVFLIIEPTDAMAEIARLALADQIPIHFVDRDSDDLPYEQGIFPDPYCISRIGHYEYCWLYLRLTRYARTTPEDILREKTVAYHLRELSKSYERVFYVGGLFHFKGVLFELNRPQAPVIARQKRSMVCLAHLDEECLPELLTECPYLAKRYEEARSKPTWKDLNRADIFQDLLLEAKEAYETAYKERIRPNQWELFQRFLKNYTLISGRFVPNLYQLVIAARGTIDEDMAYEVWQKGSLYPWHSNDQGLPVVSLEGEDLFLNLRKIRLRRRPRSQRRRLFPVRVRQRHKLDRWAKEFKGHGICSYPPEDLVIEGYGKYLMKKALEIKTNELYSVEPFLSSVKDGIDIRETIRRWTEGKLFVKEEGSLKGRAGSLVVIFDPDHPDEMGLEQFPWKVTWHGEHSQESDMAFYSTPAGLDVVGPGISRCVYGGFMMTYPPMRLADVWRDPYFDGARDKPERLLLAALDYSLEKHVVYVAPKPPAQVCQRIAEALGKSIIYLPLGALSKGMLRKIRYFHVLDGHPVRAYASEYIRRPKMWR